MMNDLADLTEHWGASKRGSGTFYNWFLTIQTFLPVVLSNALTNNNWLRSAFNINTKIMNVRPKINAQTPQ